MMQKMPAILRSTALLLSHGMCALVAWAYCSLLWGGRYAGWSAPASVAFLYVIPFAAGIAVCLILARHFRKKTESHEGK